MYSHDNDSIIYEVCQVVVVSPKLAPIFADGSNLMQLVLWKNRPLL